MQESEDRADVLALSAVAEAHGIFAALGLRLHERSEVREVRRSLHCAAGPSIDFCTDAELATGEAVSWGLEARFEDGEWVIESSIRRNHAKGEDLVRELPTRFAVDVEDFAQELLAAARMVTAVLPDKGLMFVGEGYGEGT